MGTKTLKVLFVTAEVAPFSSVGGLSQVSLFLPRALQKMGVDVRIFTPKYGIIDSTLLQTKNIIEGLKIPTDEKSGSAFPENLICNVKTLKKTNKDDPPIYFLENMEYYEKRANVYNYSDDHIRFGLLSRAALEFIKEGDFVPNVIHANDWHTGYLINYLKLLYADDPKLKDIATLFSIHNLYQGLFDFDHASEMDFDDGKGPLASFFSDQLLKQNALKRGIINADLINTVSQTYSRELFTEEYAPKLYNLFRELRGKMYGVLNGLNYQDFNPKTDNIISANYSSSNPNPRRENKVALQKEFNLKADSRYPILGIVGRLDDQKGMDLVKETIDFLLTESQIQLVVCGGGDDRYRDLFVNLEKTYPGMVGTHLLFDPSLPRKIFAGADMILIPSRYEPGGIVALEAMRYGGVPIVRATGGLADSVVDYDPTLNIGCGFSFRTYSPMSFLTAVIRALETYKNKNVWMRIVKRAMEQDFSWDKSAKKYLELYNRAIDL